VGVDVSASGPAPIRPSSQPACLAHETVLFCGTNIRSKNTTRCVSWHPSCGCTVSSTPRRRRKGLAWHNERVPARGCRHTATSTCRPEAPGNPFCSASARDEKFLAMLSEIKPDLCITAAYGNFLPQHFLDIPRLGTLNIHPSLLPHFRGAAPVPRALEAGVSETGVSIAFTELKMDSGPILAQPRVALSGSEHAPELLESLFDLGTDTLISLLPSVFSGDAARSASPQNHEHASHAPKLSKEEGRLTFVENAVIVHNKVRAFAGWPGTWAEFEIDRGDDKGIEPIQLKILETKVTRSAGGMCLGVHDVRISEDGNGLAVTCDDGSALMITSVQPSGKNPMAARSFWNGLRGKPLGRKRVPH
jgi:methionyl-tRNA formyltransferase